MKTFFTAIALCLGLSATAQQPTATIQTVSLEDVVIKNSAGQQYANKVRSENVHIQLYAHSGKDNGLEKTFFVTKVPPLSDRPVLLHGIEVKLKSFDTSLFDVKLLVMQINGKDTMRKITTIDASKLRKNKMTVLFDNEDIELQPGECYLGYGFHIKNLQSPYMYRLYSSTKGEGGIITFLDDGINVTIAPQFPYIFPFNISYRTL